jgi:hypothetical protein
MRIRHELRYDAPPDEVYAMLADPAFRERVGTALHVVRQQVSVVGTADGMDVRIDMVQRTDGIPAFARKVVGGEVRVVQTEGWESEKAADLEIVIPGMPGHIRGRLTLSGVADGTVETFDGEATITVPLVAGRLEGLIQTLFTSAMDAERATGERWLAGRS